MTATYIALANITLAATSTSITFGSIPATYRDLVIIFQGQSGGPTNFQTRMRINGDTGANYNWQRMSGTGTNANASTMSNQTQLSLTFVAEAQTTTQVQHQINIMDYSATDKHKTTVSRADNATQATEAVVGRWASTAAVTSVQLFPSSASFAIGTTVALYGIVS